MIVVYNQLNVCATTYLTVVVLNKTKELIVTQAVPTAEYAFLIVSRYAPGSTLLITPLVPARPATRGALLPVLFGRAVFAGPAHLPPMTLL